MRLLLSLVLIFALASPSAAYYPRRYGYGSYYARPYYSYGGAGGVPWAYGGFGGYQPWSSSIYTSHYGGSFQTFNGGMMLPGMYLPYSYSVPAYGYGFGAGY
jgi:hypothetical protein